MIHFRKSSERGHFDHGWLKTYHTFSFADYQDPNWMGFRKLRVINEDFVAPGKGFGTHPHRDMEIITYVLEGSLAHKDSMGNGSTITPGEIQRMTAGTGVTHSEFNHSPTEAVHLLQIWILPEKNNLTPGYEQKRVSLKPNELCLIASRDGENGAVTVHQDIRLFACLLDKGKKIQHQIGSHRHAWLQIAKGTLQINGNELKAGDGASISSEKKLELESDQNAEFLLFDLG